VNCTRRSRWRFMASIATARSSGSTSFSFLAVDPPSATMTGIPMGFRQRCRAIYRIPCLYTISRGMRNTASRACSRPFQYWARGRFGAGSWVTIASCGMVWPGRSGGADGASPRRVLWRSLTSCRRRSNGVRNKSYSDYADRAEATEPEPESFSEFSTRAAQVFATAVVREKGLEVACRKLGKALGR
jgi:hypothetical protein